MKFLDVTVRSFDILKFPGPDHLHSNTDP